MFELTKEQAQNLAQVKEKILSGQSCVLKGSAGTGKTTVASEFIKSIDSSKVVVSAPTHKALQVLREKIGGLGFNYRTIHSSLELKKKYIGGQFIFAPDVRYPLENKIIVLDEASMVGDFLLGHIEDSFHRNNTYLFLGDIKQLPPVNETTSPIFQSDLSSFELKHIIRQADGNDIINLSMNLGKLFSKKDGQNYSWKSMSQILEKLVEANGSDDCKYLAWTNKTVNLVNRTVRGLIYGNPEQFEMGEIIRFNDTYRNLYQNSQEIEIDSIEEGKTEGYDCYKLNGNILCLRDKEQTRFKQDLRTLYKDCDNHIRDWDEYHSLRELFANISYNHALTVHKSQGSTYKETIIDVTEIKRNPNRDEMNRMLYTGLTRATTHDYLV